jgi:hypothetical protein
MAHCGGVSDKKARRLVHTMKVDRNLLKYLIEADHSGRPPLEGGLPKNAELLFKKMDDHLNAGGNKPLVQGRDLIKLGYQPGPEMGKLLKKLYEIQIERGLNKAECLQIVTKT